MFFSYFSDIESFTSDLVTFKGWKAAVDSRIGRIGAFYAILTSAGASITGVGSGDTSFVIETSSSDGLGTSLVGVSSTGGAGSGAGSGSWGASIYNYSF